MILEKSRRCPILLCLHFFLFPHKLSEVLEIADTVTILRDGKTVCTIDRASPDMNEQYLIKQMVGREITNIYPEREKKDIGETILEVRNWSAYDPNLCTSSEHLGQKGLFAKRRFSNS